MFVTCGENLVIGTDKLAKILQPSKLLDSMFRRICENWTRSQNTSFWRVQKTWDIYTMKHFISSRKLQTCKITSKDKFYEPVIPEEKLCAIRMRRWATGLAWAFHSIQLYPDLIKIWSVNFFWDISVRWSFNNTFWNEFQRTFATTKLIIFFHREPER